MPEKLDVLARGKLLSGWRSVSITRGIDTASGTFVIECLPRVPFPLVTDDEIEIYAGSDLLLKGHVDRIERTLSDSQRSARILGRDATADLVDCSAADEPVEWENVALEDLAREIAGAFGLSVDYTAGPRAPFATFRKRPGDTPWALIERACRLRGVLSYTEGDGRLVIREAGRDIADVEIVQGVNLRSGTFVADSSQRFRFYTVRGQHPGGDSYSDDFAALVSGEATDLGGRAGRRLVVQAESNVTNQTAAERAQWEAIVRATNAANLLASLSGWRQGGKPGDGPLWTVNQQVAVRAPGLDLDGYLLLRQATFTQDESSEGCELELVRPDAYRPQPDLPVQDDIMQGWLKATEQGETEPDDEPDWEG